MLNVQVICIDDQNDFTNPNGALYVKGGDENVKRGAKMIERLTDKISDIHVTLDSHNIIDISHPRWWVDANNHQVAPFTMITSADMESGKYNTYKQGARERSLAYLKALEATKRYPHVIWPEHCIIGDEGHNLNPVLSAAIHGWERKRYAFKDTVTKGSNPWTEHFSAVQAEVPDPDDVSTQLNEPLVKTLSEADMVIWIGEALSHCVANTFRDVVNSAFFKDPELVKKMVLCVDATSNVPSFEKYGEDFLKEMRGRGVTLTTTVDVLS